MKIRKVLLLTMFAALCLCGCETLPPGDPPKGPIVKPHSGPKYFNRKKAANYMITSITTSCDPLISAGGYMPRIAKRFKADIAEDKQLPEEVVKSLLRMKMIRSQSLFFNVKNDYILESTVKVSRDNAHLKIWTLRFLSPDGKKLYWQDKALIDERISGKDRQAK